MCNSRSKRSAAVAHEEANVFSQSLFSPSPPFLSTITPPTSSFLPLGPMTSDSTAKPIVIGHGSNIGIWIPRWQQKHEFLLLLISKSTFSHKICFPTPSPSPLFLFLSKIAANSSLPVPHHLVGLSSMSKTLDCACPVRRRTFGAHLAYLELCFALLVLSLITSPPSSLRLYHLTATASPQPSSRGIPTLPPRIRLFACPPTTA